MNLKSIGVAGGSACAVLVLASLVGATAAVPAPPAVQLDVVWKRPLGSGHSRVAVADGRLVTLFSDGTSDHLVALDSATGAELWRHRIGDTYRGHDGSRDGPHASPVVDGNVVYGLGPRGELFAVALDDGSPIWIRHLVDDLGVQAPFWGFASTPVVAGGVLVVPTGGGSVPSVSGFDTATGERLWSTGEDIVGYQSPALMTLAGMRQVVAVTNHHVMGLVPDTGEMLWSWEHSQSDVDGSSEPVAVADDRLMLTASFTEHVSDTILLRVEGEAGSPRVDRVWSSSALKFSYTTPVRADRYLYGFQRSFLTCVDLETGRPMWKSREPGGSNLILVEDRLVVLGVDGSVIVASATPDGYRELGRVKALATGGSTAPVHQDGLVYVRNHEEVAAIRMRDAGDETVAPVELRASGTPPGTFAAFISEVEQAPQADRSRLIREFVDRQSQFPIVGDDGSVHVVYQGPANDVAVQGIDTAWDEAHPLIRVPGTDFFYRSYSLDPGGRWQYAFEIDMARWVRDPLNPRTAPGPEADSELVTPGWTEPGHLEAPTGERGTLDAMAFHSDRLGNDRDVRVYLPSGYAGTNDRYPLVVVVDGLAALEYASADRSLDNLVGDTVRPAIVAFVGPSKTPGSSYRDSGGPEPYQEHGGPATANLARALADELVPRIDSTYRTIRRPEARAVTGIRAAGLVALYTGVFHSSVFGKVGIQSMLFGPTPLQSSQLRRRPVYEEILTRLDAGPTLSLDFYVDWARGDLWSRQEGIDLAEDHRDLVDRLRRRGYRVAGGEYPGAAGWGSWRARTNALLEAMVPAGRQP